MFPACTKGGGQAFAFPDVCKVPAPPAPPIPVPFPNFAQLAAANGGTCAKKVKIVCMAAILKTTEIPMTSGDEAGVAMGVKSGTIMQKAVFKAGSAKVKVEGKALVTLLKPTAHNGSSSNAPGGMVIAPSQTKVFIGG